MYLSSCLFHVHYFPHEKEKNETFSLPLSLFPNDKEINKTINFRIKESAKKKIIFTLVFFKFQSKISQISHFDLPIGSLNIVEYFFFDFHFHSKVSNLCKINGFNDSVIVSYTLRHITADGRKFSTPKIQSVFFGQIINSVHILVYEHISNQKLTSNDFGQLSKNLSGRSSDDG